MSEYRLFFREFLQNFRTTGAILPSGRWLAKALSRYVSEPSQGPRRILEVGPGTGAVTRGIICAMQPMDQLDLVEVNESFVRQLEQRFQSDAQFRSVAGRARVLHCAVEEMSHESSYDLIVSGLPLNNFSVDLVEKIFQVLLSLMAGGGTFSFFEYVALRRAKRIFSGAAERQRLWGVEGVMRGVLRRHEIRREAVWCNVPPAWVHHVRV